MFDEEKSKHETFVFELKTHEPKAEDPYLVEEPHSALLPKNNSPLTNGSEEKKDKKKKALPPGLQKKDLIFLSLVFLLPLKIQLAVMT